MSTATDWKVAIEEMIAPYLHQIPYGNLRSEFKTWEEINGPVSNLAIVYEMPGGSTNQINISYFAAQEMFTYLSLDAHEEKCTTSREEVLRMVKDAVARIPAIRRKRLTDDIDRWAGQGLTQSDLFQQLNKMLQIEDLRGGVLTIAEMRVGIAYIMAHFRNAST